MSGYRDDRLGEATFQWKGTTQTVDVLSVRPSDWTAHIRTVTGFTTQVPLSNLEPKSADDNFALLYEEWEATL